MLTVLAGSCALASCPNGVWKTLVDGLPVCIKGSSFLLQWYVTPESAMMVGICPLYTCCWSLFRFMLVAFVDQFV